MNKYYVYNDNFCFIVLANSVIDAIMKTIDKIPDKIKGDYINVSESGTKLRKPDKSFSFQTSEMMNIYNKGNNAN